MDTIPVRTLSGHLLDLRNPKAEYIRVEDISYGLANQCRFIGQMYDFYSIAQHTLLVMSLVEPRLQFHALNHDNTEAYMGDVSRYLKHHPLMKGYRILEADFGAFLDDVLGLTPLDDLDLLQLHSADDLAAVFEHVMLRLRTPFDPYQHLPWAIASGFITRSSLANMRALMPRLDRHRRMDNGRYTITPFDSRIAQKVWLSEWKFLNAHREDRYGG